jgi:hypothetical protein
MINITAVTSGPCLLILQVGEDVYVQVTEDADQLPDDDLGESGWKKE